MRLASREILVVVCFCAAVLMSATAGAQNWSFDARNVGLGGVGSTSNIALDMVDDERPFRAIVLPFGLFQILPNLPTFDPTSDDFDLVRAIEYAASPIHYIVGRNDGNAASSFVNDLRNGTLNRDLNTYRGFDPPTSLSAEGLASPTWGGTIKVSGDPNGPFHGIYLGAGPVHLTAHHGHDRSRAGSGVRECRPCLRSEHQLLYLERHAQSGRRGGHGRIPGSVHIARCFGVCPDRGPLQRPRRAVRRHERPLPPRIPLRALRARRQARHQRPGPSRRRCGERAARDDRANHVDHRRRLRD